MDRLVNWRTRVLRKIRRKYPSGPDHDLEAKGRFEAMTTMSVPSDAELVAMQANGDLPSDAELERAERQ